MMFLELPLKMSLTLPLTLPKVHVGTPFPGDYRRASQWQVSKRYFCLFDISCSTFWLGLPVGTVVKNLPASAGDARDTASMSKLGKFPWSRKEQTTPVFFAWRIPWTEKPGRLQSWGSQKGQTQLSAHTHTRTPSACKLLQAKPISQNFSVFPRDWFCSTQYTWLNDTFICDFYFIIVVKYIL